MHMSRMAIIGAGGIVAASAVFGSAAGLTNTVAKLGGSQAVVATCDPDGVTTNWTSTYDSTLMEYKVATVTISGIADPECLGALLRVTLTKVDGTALGSEMTYTMLAGQSSHQFTVGGTTIKASDVQNVAVVLVGP